MMWGKVANWLFECKLGLKLSVGLTHSLFSYVNEATICLPFR